MRYKGTKQAQIGKGAERRLKTELDIPGAHFLPALDVHHDLHWVLGDYDFAIECKTLQDRYTNGRRGAVKLRSEQIHALTLLWQSDSSVKPILIIELRPPNKVNRTWMVIPWKLVFDKWNESKKAQMPLYFWWVIRNGLNLHCWLKLLKRGLLTKDGSGLIPTMQHDVVLANGVKTEIAKIVASRTDMKKLKNGGALI